MWRQPVSVAGHQDTFQDYPGNDSGHARDVKRLRFLRSLAEIRQPIWAGLSYAGQKPLPIKGARLQSCTGKSLTEALSADILQMDKTDIEGE